MNIGFVFVKQMVTGNRRAQHLKDLFHLCFQQWVAAFFGLCLWRLNQKSRPLSILRTVLLLTEIE